MNKRPFLRRCPRQLDRSPRGRGQSRGLWPGRGGRVAKVTRAGGRAGAGKSAPLGSGQMGGRLRGRHERPEAQLHLRGLRRVGASAGGARVRAWARARGLPVRPGPGVSVSALAERGAGDVSAWRAELSSLGVCAPARCGWVSMGTRGVGTFCVCVPSSRRLFVMRLCVDRKRACVCALLAVGRVGWAGPVT